MVFTNENFTLETAKFLSKVTLSIYSYERGVWKLPFTSLSTLDIVRLTFANLTVKMPFCFFVMHFTGFCKESYSDRLISQ